MSPLDSITLAFRRIVPALGCALVLGACTTWVDTAASTPAPAARRELGGTVRVIRHDGASVQVRNAYVTGDTLYGLGSETRMAVPMRDVSAIQRKEVDPRRSLGVLAAGAAAVAATYVLTLVYFSSGG